MIARAAAGHSWGACVLLLSHEEELVAGLEGEVQLHDVGVADVLQRAALRHGVRHILAPYHLVLVQHFHRLEAKKHRRW